MICAADFGCRKLVFGQKSLVKTRSSYFPLHTSGITRYRIYPRVWQGYTLKSVSTIFPRYNPPNQRINEHLMKTSGAITTSPLHYWTKTFWGVGGILSPMYSIWKVNILVAISAKAGGMVNAYQFHGQQFLCASILELEWLVGQLFQFFRYMMNIWGVQ